MSIDDSTPDTRHPFGLADLKGMIACSQCDALHRVSALPEGARARCSRCHVQLVAERKDAFGQVILLSLTVLILMVGAMFFPFLRIEVGGMTHNTSVVDAALAFSTGLMMPLAVAVAALIIMIPLIRVAALIYTLWPLSRGRRAYAHATQAFRLAEGLRPWSMAEIFILGVGVALVKVADLAQIHIGPAFWAFSALVIVIVLKDSLMCRWTVWNSIETSRTS